MYEQENERRAVAFYGSSPSTWESAATQRFDSGHIEAARSAVAEFAGPQFKKLMASSLGNNPSLVNVLGKMNLEIKQLRARLGRVYNG